MRRTIKLNNDVLKRMKKIYYPEGVEYIDWMGFRITEENKPSYHHIVKKEDLKKEHENYDATVDNGAYLGKKSHELLHKIEVRDISLYEMWNDLFVLINKSKSYPSESTLNMIYDLKDKSLQLTRR